MMEVLGFVGMFHGHCRRDCCVWCCTYADIHGGSFCYHWFVDGGFRVQVKPETRELKLSQ